MSEFLDLKTEIGSLKLESLAKGKRIKELEAQIALLRTELEKIERLSINFMNETGGIIREPLNRIQELAEQALSSSPSGFLEAMREVIIGMESLLFAIRQIMASDNYVGLDKIEKTGTEALSKLRRWV